MGALLDLFPLHVLEASNHERRWERESSDVHHDTRRLFGENFRPREPFLSWVFEPQQVRWSFSVAPPVVLSPPSRDTGEDDAVDLWEWAPGEIGAAVKGPGMHETVGIVPQPGGSEVRSATKSDSPWAVRQTGGLVIGSLPSASPSGAAWNKGGSSGTAVLKAAPSGGQKTPGGETTMDWTVEWRLPYRPNHNWKAPEDTASFQQNTSVPIVWAKDELKFTAIYPPDEPVNYIEWQRRPLSGGSWEAFGTCLSDQDCTFDAEAVGVGAWEIRFVLYGGSLLEGPAKPLGIAAASVPAWTAASGAQAGELVEDPHRPGAWWFYPDAQFDAATNRWDRAWNGRVDVQYTVQPVELVGIRVCLEAFDIDDLSAHEGVIDDDTDSDNDNTTGFSDQYGGMGGFVRNGAVVTELCVEVGEEYSVSQPGRWLVTVPFDVVGTDDRAQPGDNYRIGLTGHKADELDFARPYESHTAPGDELFLDWDGDGVRQQEPRVDESETAYNLRVSAPLVVWRWLNVEVDSMAGGPPQPGPDDVQFNDVPDPDLQALARAMAGQQGDSTLDYPGAFVSVRQVEPTHWNEPRVQFEYCFEDKDGAYLSTARHVQSLSHEGLNALWLANVTGAYEPGYPPEGGDDRDPALCGFDSDNDPDEENARAGHTPYWLVSLVFMEVARDLALEKSLMFNEVVSFITAHEVGHQFTLTDTGGPEVHLMDSGDVEQGQAAWRWRDLDITTIRDISSP